MKQLVLCKLIITEEFQQFCTGSIYFSYLKNEYKILSHTSFKDEHYEVQLNARAILVK